MLKNGEFCKEENVKLCPSFCAVLVAPQDPCAMDEARIPGLVLGALVPFFPFPCSRREQWDVLRARTRMS